MTKFFADIKNFQGKYASLNGADQILLASKLQLALAALSFGQSSFSGVFKLGFCRIVQLLFTIFGNVGESKTGLCIYDSYYDLEKSEKDSISFLLGMSFTKLFAEQKLKVPWLLHVSKYPNIRFSGKATKKSKMILCRNNNKAKAPDFIGLDSSSAYHVFEAKGSCGTFKKQVLQHAIDQVSQVELINGVKPETLVACYFLCSPTGVRGKIFDPETSKDGIEINLVPDKVMKRYYQLFLDKNWTDFREQTIGKHQYLVKEIGLSFHWGIRTDYFEAINENQSFESLQKLTRQFEFNSFTVEDFEFENAISADGTILYSSKDQNAKIAPNSSLFDLECLEALL